MNKFKKTLLVGFGTLLTVSNISFAEYRILLPLEQSEGGSLPNGSIKIQSASANPG